MSGEAAEPVAAGSQTLERGLAVLLELSLHPEGLTATRVATVCGLHRSITYRLLVSLHRTGFVTKDGDGRYRVGPMTSHLAERVRPRLRDVAEPVLHRLAQKIDATASLVEVVGEAAVATVVAEPPTDGPRFSYRLGNRDPLDRGAGGIAALASGVPREGEPGRVTATRNAGYVTSSSEVHPGAYGLAAPLSGWTVLAAINVVTNREDLLTSAVPSVLRAVLDITASRHS